MNLTSFLNFEVRMCSPASLRAPPRCAERRRAQCAPDVCSPVRRVPSWTARNDVFLLNLTLREKMQGCAGIVHVEGIATGSTLAVAVSVSAEMVIAAASGVPAWLWVAPREKNRRGNTLVNCCRAHLVVMEPVLGSWARSACSGDRVLRRRDVHTCSTMARCDA